jgi:signal peptidase II
LDPQTTTRIARVYITALLCLGLDQATKTVVRAQLPIGKPLDVTPFFSLFHVINRGGAFSLLYGRVGFLALVAIAVVVGIIVYERRHPAMPKWQASALGILLGGTFGNLVDRLVFGEVTDFLDFHLGPHRWPTFNVADVCINLGVLTLILGTAIARPSTEDSKR